VSIMYLAWAVTEVCASVVDPSRQLVGRSAAYISLAHARADPCAQWTHTEQVVRYPWYALSSANVCPPWLTWLR
jgi:hypothetical protein